MIDIEEYAKGGVVDMMAFLNDLPDTNIDLDTLGVSHSEEDNIFDEKKRKAWNNSIEARCDFNYKLRITCRSGINFISIWQKSLYGRTLSDIKGDDSMVTFFAQHLAPTITDTIGAYLSKGDWAIVTTPKRRHLTKNFATRISEVIAQHLGITFYEDVAFCRSRERINAVFSLGTLPMERNIIVFDDFVTTGQTLRAMYNLLNPLGKNLVFFAGINNKL